MTWIKVDLTEIENRIPDKIRAVFRYRCRQYLRNELSSNGVLWKNDWSESIYYFAQSDDALVFKIKFLGIEG